MTTTALILGALATCRLAWLVARDSITAPLRDWTARKGTTSGVWRWLGELVECPWCVSVWAGMLVAVTGWWWAGEWWWYIPVAGLAFSGVGVVFAAVMDRLTAD